LAVLDWYGKNYRHAGDWFIEDMRTPTSSEITKGMNPATKAHAEALIAFKESPKCIERLMANARAINFA
jgi:SOS-response transcriptional repressor LexA